MSEKRKNDPLSPYLRRTSGEAPAEGDEPILVRLGANVRKLRELHGWSQTELAERCGGKSQLWVSYIERGVRDTHVSSLALLAKALKANVPALLG